MQLSCHTVGKCFLQRCCCCSDAPNLFLVNGQLQVEAVALSVHPVALEAHLNCPMVTQLRSRP